MTYSSSDSRTYLSALLDSFDSRLNGSIYRSIGKRGLDSALVIIALPVLMLIIPIIWAVIRSDGGPALFRHRRVGRHGKPFYCWKFRTMVPDAEARLADYLIANPEAAEEWRTTFKLRNDPRITGFGRWARKTSLDELPQLWNVIRGDMSLVGPRPVVEAELDFYGRALPIFQSVRPGLTGLWQVSGRNDVSYDKRVLMDCLYATKVSLRLDIKIMLKTVSAVIKQTGK